MAYVKFLLAWLAILLGIEFVLLSVVAISYILKEVKKIMSKRA